MAQNTKIKKSDFPEFHTIRISHSAFVAVTKKKLEAMNDGKRKKVSEIASEILEAI